MQIKITGKFFGKQTIIAFLVTVLIIVLIMLWFQQRAMLQSMERIESYLGKAFESVDPQDMRQMEQRIRLLSSELKPDETRLLAVLMCTEAKRNRVPVMLVFWLTWYESGFNSKAESEKGCVGDMQLNPKTFPYPKVILMIPSINITLGVRYLAFCIHKEWSDEEARRGKRVYDEAIKRYHGNKLAPRSIDLSRRVMEKYRGRI